MSHSAKRALSSHYAFFKPKTFSKEEGQSLTKFFSRKIVVKNRRSSPQLLRKLISSTRPKIIEEAILKTRKTVFLDRKPQKNVEKIFENYFRFFFQNVKLYSANKPKVALYARKMLRFC